MQGHIYKRNDTWTYVIYLGRDPVTGKKKYKSKDGYRLKKEAQVKLTEALESINSGIFVDTKNITVKDYLLKWLKDYAENNVKYKTYVSYQGTVENHLIPNLGNYKLDKLNPSIIQNYYTSCINQNNLSNTSILYNHKILKQAINQAIKWQILKSNPCDAVTPPRKNKPKLKTLTVDEIEKVLNFCENKHIYIVIFLALGTGMRRGEICGLKWVDVDLQKGMIYVQDSLQRKKGESPELASVKTDNSKRAIAIAISTLSYLKQIKKRQKTEKIFLGENYKDDDFVCAWEDGRPTSPDYVTNKFSKIIKALGLDGIRFHDLRHTHATFMLKADVHPKIVSERLGHSSVSITLDIYSHAMPTMQIEAAEKLEQAMFSKNKKKHLD